MATPSERKPLAALLVAKPEGEPDGDEGGSGGDSEGAELDTAVDAAAMLGAKDPQAAGAALVDLVRQCIARSKAGEY